MERVKSFLLFLLVQAVVWGALVLHFVHAMPGALNLLRFYGAMLLFLAGLQLVVALFGKPIKPPERRPEHLFFRASGWVFLGACVWGGMWLLVVASVAYRVSVAINRIAYDREVAHG